MRSDVRISGLLIMVFAMSGCLPRTMAIDSSVDRWPTLDGEIDFWDELSTRPVVTNNDALHGLLLVAVHGDPAADFPSRVAVASERGWLNGSSGNLLANESARVGLISVAVCEVLAIEGGLTMHLLGPTPRWCTRELVYQNVIPDRTEDQGLTGGEFIDLLRRVENALKRRPEYILDSVSATADDPPADDAQD